MTNLCRDEVTAVLKDKIESIFGASFNTNGLGAGEQAGLSPNSAVHGSKHVGGLQSAQHNIYTRCCSLAAAVSQSHIITAFSLNQTHCDFTV